MKRKICVITGTRAEYGLLKWLMYEIAHSSLFELQIIVTGQHLSNKFGLTYQEIVNDGFQISKKVDMLLDTDNSIGVAKSVGLGVLGFGEAFDVLIPDLVLVLGDRYELLAAVTAALMFRIPVAHLHGGETTEGAIDEAIRHAITKMAHLHFVAAEDYRKRVIQLGEQPDRVFLVGGLGVDSITKMDLLSKEILEEKLGFRFLEKNLLVTFHPVTLEKESSLQHMKELLRALECFPDIGIIFTAPNCDPDNTVIFQLIENFCWQHPHARMYTSLGNLNYYSCLKYVDVMVGNSSSGLTEAPTFKIATVNIGDRQKGRLKADSVLDCESNCDSIVDAVSTAFTDNFKERLPFVVNPYGDGGASKKIIEILETVDFDGLLKKTFYDVLFDYER